MSKVTKYIIYSIALFVFVGGLLLINNFLDMQNKKTGISDSELSQNSNDGKILEVTSENFEKEVLESKKTVLIDFYADWCGPCHMLSPIVEEIAKENSDIKVVKINIDDEEKLAIKYKILSIPTLIVIKNGIEKERVVGVVEKEEIIEMIKCKEE